MREEIQQQSTKKRSHSLGLFPDSSPSRKKPKTSTEAYVIPPEKSRLDSFSVLRLASFPLNFLQALNLIQFLRRLQSSHRTVMSANLEHTSTLNMASVQHPESVNGLAWPCLHEEMHRLSTFARYSRSNSKSRILLAKNGFAYIGNGDDGDDSVICVFCYLRHQNWSENDDIIEFHRRLSPNCPFIAQRVNSNVTIGLTNPSSNHSSLSQVSDEADMETDSDIDEADHSDITHSQASLNAQTARPLELVGNVRIFSASNESSSVAEMPEVGSMSSNFTENGMTQIQNQPQNLANIIQPSVNTDVAQPLSPNRLVNDLFQPMRQYHSEILMASRTAESERLRNLPELGIVFERPKRPQFASRVVREQSFIHWPRDHQIPVTDLVQAGFFYAGYSDCARCFYCGGGLRNWEPQDNCYVEHARWFPKCAFVRQTLGMAFINAVQELNNEGLDVITIENVLEKLGQSHQLPVHGGTDNVIAKDPAVLALCDLGYTSTDVVHAAKILKSENENVLSAEALLDYLEEKNKYPLNSQIVIFCEDRESDPQKMKEKIENLKIKNLELRKQRSCKVCLDKPVSVLFLPCSHTVCCIECSTCLRTCPICRKDIRGVVHITLR